VDSSRLFSNGKERKLSTKVWHNGNNGMRIDRRTKSHSACNEMFVQYVAVACVTTRQFYNLQIVVDIYNILFGCMHGLYSLSMMIVVYETYVVF